MKDNLVFKPDETVTEAVDRRTFPHTVYATVKYADPMHTKYGPNHPNMEWEEGGRSYTILEEADPTGLQPGDAGAKLDSGKVMTDLLQDFSKALLAVAEVSTFGAGKYSRGGWLQVPDGYNRYSAAMMRHWLKEKYEDVDSDSGLSHQAHLAWNSLARLQFLLEEKEK